jgi:hypothetical protein
VGLDGVLAHEQPLGDLLVAQARRHGLEDVQLAGREAQSRHPGLVAHERLGPPRGHLHAHFPRHHAFARELLTEPDADHGEEQRHDATVELERVLDDQVSIFDQLEQRDHRAAQQAIEEHGLLHERGTPSVADPAPDRRRRDWRSYRVRLRRSN